MEHIYTCKYLNSDEVKLSYKHLFSGNLTQQITVCKRFQNNFEKREKRRTEILNNQTQTDLPHEIRHCDPLFSNCIDNSNGFK